MKSLRILFSVMFLMSLATACDDDKKTTKNEICNNQADDDGDGLQDCDDSDCNGNAACAANNVNNTNNLNNINNTNNVNNPETNCVNDQDDDGDGLTDCSDSDCVNDAACQVASCTLETLFFDSPATCDAGFQCSVNDTYAATCQPDAMFAGGDFYGACGANGECPFGSICAGSSQDDLSCMPFCQAETHPGCPESGICMYSLTDSTLNLCALPDNCDPFENTGCTGAGEGCYFLPSEGTSTCVGAGDGAVGDTCQYLNDCTPGLLCNGTCAELCDGTHTCTTGTCNTGYGLPDGKGLCE